MPNKLTNFVFMSKKSKRPNCLTCNSKKVVKNGLRKGKQCWMCNDCKSQHVENPVVRGIVGDKVKLLKKLMSERMSIRGITRVLEVSRNTVVKQMRAIEAQVPENLSVTESENMNLAEDVIENR